MMDEAYERLADALDRLPNGFPRTPSKAEIRVLQKLFTPDEAQLASQLGKDATHVEKIAEIVGKPAKEIQEKLMDMAKRGLVWFYKINGKAHFRLAPFVVGIYEASLDRMDHEFAHLVEEYFDEGGLAGMMKLQPALHRVVPARGTAKTEWILPYDDVRALLEKAKTFHVRDCICRIQQDMIDQRRCDFPMKMCVSFSSVERPARPGDITKDEALAILDEAEKIGLVHTVSNVIEDIFYVCNCCGCCCGVLRGITDYGIQDSVAHANYYAVVDPNMCSGCGVCIERCQIKAISEKDGGSVVLQSKCIGCGLCVTGCPEDAVHLVRKPDAEIVNPPNDFDTWEQARLRTRGLKK